MTTRPMTATRVLYVGAGWTTSRAPIGPAPVPVSVAPAIDHKPEPVAARSDRPAPRGGSGSVDQSASVFTRGESARLAGVRVAKDDGPSPRTGSLSSRSGGEPRLARGESGGWGGPRSQPTSPEEGFDPGPIPDPTARAALEARQALVMARRASARSGLRLPTLQPLYPDF